MGRAFLTSLAALIALLATAVLLRSTVGSPDLPALAALQALDLAAWGTALRLAVWGALGVLALLLVLRVAVALALLFEVHYAPLAYLGQALLLPVVRRTAGGVTAGVMLTTGLAGGSTAAAVAAQASRTGTAHTIVAVATARAATGQQSLPVLPTREEAEGHAPVGGPVHTESSVASAHDRRHLAHHRLSRGRALRDGAMTYTVQRGDSLAVIAARFYGDAEAYRHLFRANRGRLQSDGGCLTQPELIMPGWRLLIPLPSPVVSVGDDGQLRYVVQQGDSLSGIAAFLLSDWHRYKELFALNRGQPQVDGRALVDPARLQPGWALRVPVAVARHPRRETPQRHSGATRRHPLHRQARAHRTLRGHVARVQGRLALVPHTEPEPPVARHVRVPRTHPVPHAAHRPSHRPNQPAAGGAPQHRPTRLPAAAGMGDGSPSGVWPPVPGPAPRFHPEPAAGAAASHPLRRAPRSQPTVWLPDGHVLPTCLAVLFLGLLARAAWRRRRSGSAGAVPWRLSTAPLMTMVGATVWPGVKGWLEAALAGRMRGDEASPVPLALARLHTACAERSLDPPRVRWVREGDRVLQVALLADHQTVHALEAAAPDLAHAMGCATVSVRAIQGGAVVVLEGMAVPVCEGPPDQGGDTQDAGQGPGSILPTASDPPPVPLLVSLGEAIADARSTVLHVNLGELPSLLLASGPAGDAETILVTLLTQLVGQASPAQLQLLISAETGRVLDLLRPLPHLVAPLVDVQDRTGLAALLDRAEATFVERAATGGKVSGAPAPDLLLVVSRVEDILGDPLLTARLDALCRNGAAYGLHVVATTDELSALEAEGALLSAFPARLSYGAVDGWQARLAGAESDADGMGVGDLIWDAGDGASEALRSTALRQGEAREVIAVIAAHHAPDPALRVIPRRDMETSPPATDQDGDHTTVQRETINEVMFETPVPLPVAPVAQAEPAQAEDPTDIPQSSGDIILRQSMAEGATHDQQADDPTPPADASAAAHEAPAQDGPPAGAPVTVHLLGRICVEVRGASEAMDDGGLSAHQREFLAFLALQGPRPVPWMEAALAFWPEADQDKARNNFHQKVSQLRLRLGERLKLPGEEILSQGMDGYRLNTALVWVDALAFEQRLQEADAAVNEERARHLQRAIDLYQGDLMGTQSPDWAQPKVLDLRDQHLDAVWELSRWAEEQGDPQEALALAARLVRFDPTREVYHRRLMQLQACAGDQGAVERTYADVSRVLREEMDMAPSEETRRLYACLMKQDDEGREERAV